MDTKNNELSWTDRHYMPIEKHYNHDEKMTKSEEKTKII